MASHENDKAMDGLLRRSLARDSAAAGACPGSEVLAAYYDRSLGQDEAADHELHFSRCSRCREQLAAMARADVAQEAEVSLEPTLVSARAREARVAAQAAPVLAAQPARARASEKPQPRPWLDLRWLAPVAAVLVLSAFAFVRFASRGTSRDLGSQVAMNAHLDAEKQSAPAATASPEAEPPDTKGTPKKPETTSAAPSNQPTQPRASASSSSSSPPSSSAKPASPKPAQALQTPPARHEEISPSYAPRTTGAAGAVGRSAPGSKSVRPASPARTGPLYARNAAEAPAPMMREHLRAGTEPAPAAPAPEPSKALPNITVEADSSEAVVSPPPPPPSTAEKKSAVAGGRMGAFSGNLGAHSIAKSKSEAQRSTVAIITTPDSDVLYRIITGGYVEVSDDTGATWKSTLVDPSANFTAGSAPQTRICWLVGREGFIFLAEDGKNWRRIASPTSSDLAVVIARSAASATVTASDGRKWSTDDAGKNWQPAE